MEIYFFLKKNAMIQMLISVFLYNLIMTSLKQTHKTHAYIEQPSYAFIVDLFVLSVGALLFVRH